jgi:DHA1 family multidrug resistance protein-like MFS transporter
MACFRLICAGVVPIFILDMFAKLTGAWALSTFGFIAVAMLPFPFILFFRGEKMRLGSRYGNMHDASMKSGSDVMSPHREHNAA